MPEITEADRAARRDAMLLIGEANAWAHTESILDEAFSAHREAAEKRAISAERERIASRLAYFHIDPQIVDMVRDGR